MRYQVQTANRQQECGKYVHGGAVGGTSLLFSPLLGNPLHILERQIPSL